MRMNIGTSRKLVETALNNMVNACKSAGTMTNLFVVRNGRLLTPDVSQCGVAGVMRSWILACARVAGISSAITSLTLDMSLRLTKYFCVIA